ncbi:hypothetical protein TPENAI_70417 [Tenacibaculum litopenaei]|uniref:hypothetical protein n=1 Tax=Tenacibaculum litopenaei TaxID=396016 RepID=UPI0038938EEF
MDEVSLIRYLERKVTRKEERVVIHWIRKSKGNQELFNKLKANWVLCRLRELERKNEVQFRIERNKIQRRRKRGEKEVEKTMEKKGGIYRKMKQEPIHYALEEQKIAKQETSTSCWERISRTKRGRIVEREQVGANWSYLRLGNKLLIALSTVGLLLMAGCLKAFC